MHIFSVISLHVHSCVYSVVIKDVPPYTVVGGVPARVLKTVRNDSVEEDVHEKNS